MTLSRLAVPSDLDSSVQLSLGLWLVEVVADALEGGHVQVKHATHCCSVPLSGLLIALRAMQLL